MLYGLFTLFAVVQEVAPTARHCRLYPVAPMTALQETVALLPLILLTDRLLGARQLPNGAQDPERQVAPPTSVRILLPGSVPKPLLKLIPLEVWWQ